MNPGWGQLRGREGTRAGPDLLSLAKLDRTASFEGNFVLRYLQRESGVVGGERKRKGGGCPVSEEVEASAQAGRVPDHLSLRKDISFFAPIVPPSAETTNHAHIWFPTIG